MAICSFKSRKDVRICSGDLDRAILIQVRTLVSPEDTDGDVDYNETFSEFIVFWSLIETVKGETVFDESNVEQVVTHKFYIRYAPDITFQDWVTYNDKNYKIIDVQNINERDEFYLLRCTLRGSSILPVNLQ